MNLAQKVAALQAEGLTAARQILARILAPTKVEGTALIQRDTAAAEKALRNLVVPELLSNAQWALLAGQGALDDRIQFLVDKRIRDADTDAKVLAALRLQSLVAIAERRIERKGGTAWSALAGAETRTEPTVADGPSWWDQNFPGQPEPTIQHIREAMQ